METIFIQYLSASISASILILFLFLGKQIWKQTFSKAWQYYIWLLVVFRLLIPISPAPGMVGNVMNLQADILGETNMGAALTINKEPDVYNMNDDFQYSSETQNTLSDEEPKAIKESESRKDSLTAATLSRNDSLFLAWLFSHVWLIWLIPAVLLFLFRMIRYHSCIRSLKAMCVAFDDPQVSEVCQTVKDELGMKGKVLVFHCKSVLSPMLTGLGIPSILLPESSYTKDRLYYIFRHELLHFRRRDILYKWLVEASVCIHWFNPLVYVLRRQCDYACELSCDEAVTAGLSSKEKAAYGDTLLSSITHQWKKEQKIPKAPASMLFCENASALKERLVSVMKTKQSTRLQKAAALGVTALLSCSLLLLGTASVNAGVAKNPDNTKNSSVTDPWLNDSDNPESKKWRHSFSTITFFSNGYGIKLAWNNDPSLYETTRQILAEDTYTVSFTEETKKYADNVQVTEAIRISLLEQKEREKAYSDTDSIWASNLLTNPVIVGVDGPYNGTYDELSVQFYNENEVGYYSAVLKGASKATQNTLAERAYQDDRIPEFSIGVKYLTQAECEAYLLKAYQDEKLPYFSILSDNVPQGIISSFIDQSYDENKINFFAAVFNKLSSAEQKRYAYRAYEDEKINFFSVAVNALDSYECEELIARALREGKKTFIHVIPGYSKD